MKKPIKKDYCKPFSLDNTLQTFDSKKYSKDAELYIEHLISIMRSSSSKLRDVAISIGRGNKEVNEIHELAELLYNNTL